MRELIRTILFVIGRCFCYNNFSKVLYYHDITPRNGRSYTPMSTPYDIFTRQMEFLPKYGKIVSEIKEDKGEFMIAFDDGFKGVYDNRDYFVRKKIYPTIFIAKDLVGKDGYLDENQIKELFNLGFHFQSHTVTHVDLTALSTEDMIIELKESKSYLENLLGEKVSELCCPKGYFNDDVIREAVNAEYSRVYLSYPSPYKSNGVQIGRYLCQSLSDIQFKLMLKGGMDVLKSRYKKMHNKVRYL